MSESYQIKDQSGIYFVTFQVVGWVDIFSRQVYRDIIIESLTFCQKHNGLVIYGYVIMTNHIHLIVRSEISTLSNTIRDFKRFTSRSIMKSVDENGAESRKEWMRIIFAYHAKYNKCSGDKQFWTHENHAVQLDTNEMIDSRLNYIHENPVRAGWVTEAEHYLYSSARNYASMESLLAIEMI